MLDVYLEELSSFTFERLKADSESFLRGISLDYYKAYGTVNLLFSSAREALILSCSVMYALLRLMFPMTIFERSDPVSPLMNLPSFKSGND